MPVNLNISAFVSSCSFHAQVTENEKVSTVKELVSERLNIPPSQQRLLYKGKALAGKSIFCQMFVSTYLSFMVALFLAPPGLLCFSETLTGSIPVIV